MNTEEIKVGDRVTFTEASDEQVRFGGNKDPRDHLEIGKDYEVQAFEVHSWHTKIWVNALGIKGPFNSVHFTKKHS